MPTHFTPRDVSLHVGDGDWAEVRVGDAVVYRGHEDDCHRALVDLLQVELVLEPVHGPRVDTRRDLVLVSHTCVTCYCESEVTA